MVGEGETDGLGAYLQTLRALCMPAVQLGVHRSAGEQVTQHLCLQLAVHNHTYGCGAATGWVRLQEALKAVAGNEIEQCGKSGKYIVWRVKT